MANRRHLKILEQGVDTWNKWREENADVKPNLRGANLKGKKLVGADFSNADIHSTNFTGANLRKAKFTGAKCGLQRRWAVFLVFLSLLLLGISVISLVIIATFIAQFSTSGFEGVFVSIFIPIAVVIFFFGNLYKRPGDFSFNAGFTLAIVGLMGIIFAAIFGGLIFQLNIFDASVKYLINFGGIFVSTFAVMGGLVIACAGLFAICARLFAKSETLVEIFIVTVFALGGILAITLSFSRENNLAEAVGLIFVLGITLLSFRIAWLALREEKESSNWLRAIAIAFAAIGGTSFRGADLTDADFWGARLKSTDLRKAILTRTCWRNTKKLDRVLPGTSYLTNAQVRELVRTGEGQGKKFDNLDFLREINLKGANLTDASFIGSNLNRANLQNANLSKAKLVQTLLEGADLTGATLTGACIQDWGLSSTTKINSINCDYVYLKKPDRDRRPSDQARNFEPGEFASLVGIAANTVDLVFEHGIDWKAFLPTLEELQVKYKDEDLSIAAIEQKPDGAFVVRLNVSPEADKGEIESDAKQWYEDKLKLIEAQYRAELKSLEAEYNINLLNKEKEINKLHKKYNSDILELGKLAASRPISIEAKAVAGDEIKGVKITDIRDASITGVTGGNLSGSVTANINSPVNSQELNQQQIQDLLEQLKNAIASFQLPEKDNKKIDRDIQDIEAELVEPEADKQEVKHSLESITNRINRLSSTVDAAKQLQEKVAPVLGQIAPWLGLAATHFLPK